MEKKRFEGLSVPSSLPTLYLAFFQKSEHEGKEAKKPEIREKNEKISQEKKKKLEESEGPEKAELRELNRSQARPEERGVEN